MQTHVATDFSPSYRIARSGCWHTQAMGRRIAISVELSTSKSTAERTAVNRMAHMRHDHKRVQYTRSHTHTQTQTFAHVHPPSAIENIPKTVRFFLHILESLLFTQFYGTTIHHIIHVACVF